MKDTLFLIPARGGSKGIPGKNIKRLGGKPLLQYSIDLALELVAPEHICVSTDSAEIINVAQSLGVKVPFTRPEHLATDQAGSYEVIEHALQFHEKQGKHYSRVILLQPTSPFRKLLHVREAYALLDDNTDMVVSVKESSANPYYNLFEESSDGLLHKSKAGAYTRRQDCPAVYEFNGSIYVISVPALRTQASLNLRRIKKYTMAQDYSVDLDTPLDWTVAESLLPTLGASRE